MNISLNKKPLISVVIPTYNHAHLIEKCLQSVIDQTYTNWEAIVVNNFSKDNTIDVVEGFNDPRIRLINFNNNGIIAASRNQGIRNSNGEFIAFLDSDDWWYKDKLKVVSYYLDRYDVVFHNLEMHGQKGKKRTRKIKGRELRSPVFVDLMINGNALANSSVVVKRSLIDKAGLLDESPMLRTVEDFDLWLRVSMLTEKFKFIDKDLGAYWFGGGNSTELSEAGIKKQEYVYGKYANLLTKNKKKQTELLKKYIIGRIKQKMGVFREARALFLKSFKINNFKIKIKALFFYIVCLFKLKDI